MTLARFASELNRINTGVDGPVVDSTKISGRYDLAINFSPGPWSQITQAEQPSIQIIPISEALQEQLGLQLQTRKVFEPVLIVDHAEDAIQQLDRD